MSRNASSSSSRASRRQEVEPENIISVDGRRSSRKRVAEETEVVESAPRAGSSNDQINTAQEDEDVEEAATKYNAKRLKFSAKTKEVDSFQAIPHEAQAQCIKAISRLFIFKGGKNERVDRKLVSEVIGKIDPVYTKHTNAVLMEVQRKLKNQIGYTIVPTDAIIGLRRKDDDKKSTEYFVTNDLSSNTLKGIMNADNRNNAFFGFMCVIFYAIYTSSGKKAAVEDLLISVRKIDPRFPSRLPTQKDKEHHTAAPVEELGDDFIGLLSRMKKEHYLSECKRDDDAGSDPAKKTYGFGPRYFLDIGHLELMTSYYRIMGQPVDAHVIKEIKESIRRELEDDEEDDGEGGGGGGEATNTAAA